MQENVNDQSVLNKVFSLSTCVLSLTAQETEGLERPSERRRRKSDSSLYCKARDEATAQSERGAEIRKHLDSEKYHFVQSYVQSIQETHSMTTETTDSGIRTHGEPSDLEMQDISGKYNLVIIGCLGSQILNNY